MVLRTGSCSRGNPLRPRIIGRAKSHGFGRMKPRRSGAWSGIRAITPGMMPSTDTHVVRPTPTVVYVSDRSRLSQLLLSITSWRRFVALPVSVVDIGLSARGRAAVEAVCDGDVTFLKSEEISGIPDYVDARQAFAFFQKTLVGLLAAGDPLIFLDADILVTHESFIPVLSDVRPDELLASPSAWDTDFTWTYSAESLPFLRAATGDATLKLDHPICNSGVWAMRSASARTVAAAWSRMFRTAFNSRALRSTVRLGTQVGDQEFLLPACSFTDTSWTRLHGSFNMQIHERRMRWLAGAEGHPAGGHLAEDPQPVRSIHFGCAPDGSVDLDAAMIACPAIRGWVAGEYQCVAAVVHGSVKDVFPTWSA